VVDLQGSKGEEHIPIIITISTTPLIPQAIEHRLDGWENSLAAQAMAHHMSEDVLVYAFHVITIIETCESMMAKKITKKKELAKSANIEMSDTTKPRLLMQSMIDKAISKWLKNIGGLKKVSDSFGDYKLSN
jgi:hypothetical protein